MNILCDIHLPATPLWQLVNHGWSSFFADYEENQRSGLGPLHSAAIATVQAEEIPLDDGRFLMLEID